MKKALLALAATAATAASGAASAQTNVTLYGIVDAGIEVISNAPSAGGGDTAVRMNSGNLSGSRWGLRGTRTWAAA